MVFLIILALVCQAAADFRPSNSFIDSQPTWSSTYEDFVQRPHELKLMFNKPKNSGFYVVTKVQYYERDDTKMSDTRRQLLLYPTILNDDEFLSQYLEDYFWTNEKNYVIHEQTSEFWIQKLPSKTAFRIRIMQCDEKSLDSDTSEYTICSSWSDWKILATSVIKETFEDHEYAYLHARGTGLNNHNYSFFKIDDNEILKHAYYKGFYLFILDRKTLETKEKIHYNTIQTQEHETLLSSATRWYKQSYKLNDDDDYVEDGDPVDDQDYIYNKTNNFQPANDMAAKIREYDSNYFVVVVSNYAWESYFSEDLGRTLENCGAFLIKEFTYQAQARFGNFSRTYDFRNSEILHKTKMFHPYAFIGIPGLPPGRGFEQLRSNQGIYIEEHSLPYAELKVRLRFNNLIGMYSFDTQDKQYHRQDLSIDKSELINEMYDRSLRAVFPLQVTANLTSLWNYGTSFYAEQNQTIYYQQNSYNWTEADMVFLQKGEIPMRFDYRYHYETHKNVYTWYYGNYTFDKEKESYNRVYHYSTLKDRYTKPNGALTDEDGEQVTYFDNHLNEDVNRYKYWQDEYEGIEGQIPGWIDFGHRYLDEKEYYNWVQNWLYSELNDYENTPCEPPYNDFTNQFCFNLENYFTSNDDAPMIFKCYVGLLPFYCPWDMPVDEYQVVNNFEGYIADQAEDLPYKYITEDGVVQVTGNIVSTDYNFYWTDNKL